MSDPFEKRENSCEMESQRSPLPAKPQATLAELRLQGKGSPRERGRVCVPLFLRRQQWPLCRWWLRGDNGPGFLWLAYLFELPLVAPTLPPCLS